MTTTTVNVTTTKIEAINLPKYFRSTHYQDAYFMILDDKNYVRFFHRPYEATYADGPEFVISRVEFIASWLEKGYEEMTEQDFIEKFNETMVILNELVNNARD